MSTADANELIEELTRPVVKLVVALVGLFVLRAIVVRLPGLETQIPGDTPITISTVAGTIITLIMIGIIVNFGREIEPRLNRALSGPSSIVSALAEIVKHVVFLLAIIIAYSGVSDVVVPFLVPDPGRWVYDIAFLVIALVPTAIIAKQMFGNIDDITDLLTEQVKSSLRADGGSDDDDESEDTDDSEAADGADDDEKAK